VIDSRIRELQRRIESGSADDATRHRLRAELARAGRVRLERGDRVLVTVTASQTIIAKRTWRLNPGDRLAARVIDVNEDGVFIDFEDDPLLAVRLGRYFPLGRVTLIALGEAQ